MKRKVAVYTDTHANKNGVINIHHFEFILTGAPAAQKLTACTESRKCLYNARIDLSILRAVHIYSQVHVCAFGSFTIAHVQKQKGCSGRKSLRIHTALAFADQRTIVHCLRAHKQQQALLSPHPTIIKLPACLPAADGGMNENKRVCAAAY